MVRFIFLTIALILYAMHHAFLLPHYDSLDALTFSRKAGMLGFLAVAFVSVLTVLRAAGTLVQRLLRCDGEDWLNTIAIGFVTIGILTIGLGAVDLLTTPVLLTLHCALFFYGLWSWERGLSAIKGFLLECRRLGNEHPFLLGLTTLIVVCLGIITFVPQNHGDPLYYHLPQGWWWLKMGGTGMLDWMPWFMQGGMGEYIYTWIGGLTHERFSMMILSQMLHVFFGLGIGCLAIFDITRRFTGRGFALLAALCYLTFDQELFMMVRAKNDGFVATYCLLALRQWVIAGRYVSGRHLTLIYFFTFAALACKLTALFFLLPFFAVFLLTNLGRDGAKLPILVKHLQFAALPALVVVPIPLRNYLYSGNPFFPAYHHWFPGSFMNDFLAQEIARYGFVSGSWLDILRSQFRRLLLAKYLFPAFFLAWWDGRFFSRGLVALVILAYALICVVTGQGLYGRFTFFMYGILAITSLIGLSWLERIWLERRYSIWKRHGIVVLSTLIVLANSQIEVMVGQAWGKTVAFVMSNQSYGTFFMEKKDNYPMHRWMNEHLQKAYIFSFGDNESFLLNHPLSVPHNHRGASEVYLAKTYEAILAELKSQGFTHILFEDTGVFDRNFMPILTGDERFSRDFAEIHAVNGFRLWQWRQ